MTLISDPIISVNEEGNKWKVTSVLYAVMSMTLLSGMRTTASPREHPLRIFRRIGSALSAEQARTSLRSHHNDHERVQAHPFIYLINFFRIDPLSASVWPDSSRIGTSLQWPGHCRFFAVGPPRSGTWYNRSGNPSGPPLHGFR